MIRVDPRRVIKAAGGGLVEGASDAEGATVEDVRVDHGRGDVAMTEQLLDGADVVAGLEQVGREAVAEAVAGGALRKVGSCAGGAECLLEHGFVEVVAPHLLGVRLAILPRGREHPLPRPLARGLGILASEGAGKLDVSCATRQVRIEETPYSAEVDPQWLPQPGGQHGDAIFCALCRHAPECAPRRWRDLDAQASAFEESQPEPYNRLASALSHPKGVIARC